MQLREEVKFRLLGSRPWTVVIEELEREVEKLDDKVARAAALFELGEACEELLLQKDRARLFYQAAFKLHPRDLRALRAATRIYFELGNLEMVATLLAAELKMTEDG